MDLFKTLSSFLFLLSGNTPRGLHQEFSWTRINYNWPISTVNKNTTTSWDDTNNIPYSYENSIPMGANIWKNKLFITVPRRRIGIPSSLNFVWTNSSERHNVPLNPYPDWETNILGGPTTRGLKFVSVYRVAIDPCNRLWFVDTGVVSTLETPQVIQPPALVIMDLITDTILRYHVFDPSVLQPTSGLVSITVDVSKDQCDNAYAYIPDLGAYGLVVYSLSQGRSWRVNHNYFFLEPLAGDFSIGGYDFQWTDGVFSIALSDVNHDGYRDAYFHAMAGYNLYRVSTRILQNETLATRSYHGQDFQLVGFKGKNSQTSMSDLDKTRGVLFMGMVTQNALACWNIHTSLKDISVIQKDEHKMIYPSDVKVRDDSVIVLTNSMPVFLYGMLNYDEINFRVWVGSVDEAIKGTKCAKRG